MKGNAGNDFDVTVRRDTVQLVSYDAAIMGRGRRQKGGVIARRALIAVGILLACSPGAFALNPALDVSQYAHTAWKIREGFSKGYVKSMAQTPDGYLWLGTEFGLLRFDGVRAVPWQPPPGQHLPSSEIISLLAARDGTLWIGSFEGLASWRGGKLTQYPELAGLDIETLLEDHAGTIWAGAFSYTPPGKLCAIQTVGVQCYGEDGAFGNGVLRVYEDNKGNLWAGVRTGLWRWKPGPPKFYPLAGEPYGIQGLGESDDGTLLIAMRGRVARFVDGKSEMAYPYPGPVRQFLALKLLRDRDGGLWIGTLGRGLVHMHQGRTDVFAQSDGLSGDTITAVFEDREGSIWVATTNGLDRFRDFAAATFSVNQGLSNFPGGSVLAARDGSVWLDTNGGLSRWNNGQITTYNERTSQVAASNPDAAGRVREIRVSGFPKPGLFSLFQDDRGRIWVTTFGGVGYLENDRFISVNGVPGGIAYSIAEEAGGNLWIANLDHGLIHLRGGSMVQQIPWVKLGRKDHAMALAADSLQGGLWLGFFRGGVTYFKDGQVRASYAVADGLGEGRVNDLRFDQEGTLWAGTEGGLSRLKNGRIATLTSKSGLPCDAVHWVMEDDAHSFWLYMACGLVRIERSELDAWGAGVDASSASKDKYPKRTIQLTVFDGSDGVRTSGGGAGSSPNVGKSSDGKLWFTAQDGVRVVDPRHLPFNKLPPPVHIEQIIADRKSYDATPDGTGDVRLPPLVRDLQIDYTALSLIAPEKVLFRYKLEGWDRDWQDVGNRRQAFYGSLSPGNYRFRVIASNNSGVWNEAGSFLDFSVAPAYYQTLWFRLCFVAASLASLAALYQLRLRQLARQFNMRMEERVGERTRIARDLHDTLLQSFHGILLRFQTVSNLLPERPGEAKQRLESAIDQAAQAITEGRDAVQELRSPTVETKDLALAIRAVGEELTADETDRNSADFQVVVEGVPRNLHPLIRDEVYRIAAEALRNAFRHAQARQIEVEIRYDERELRLRIRDDGKGFHSEVLQTERRAGHYGLDGMRERAGLMGGKLTVWSELDSGTEIELSIPALTAYATPSASRRSWPFWKKTEIKS